MQGLENLGDCNDQPQGLNIISPTYQYLYLQVQCEDGSPLPSALFAKDVLAGVFITQNMAGSTSEAAQHQAPQDILILSDTEVVYVLSDTTNMDRVIVLMSALGWWIGQKVTLHCRVATQEEVEAAKEREAREDEVHHHQQHNGNVGDERFMRMMDDIHRLAAGPPGEALRIPTFSGVVPPPKNEATFAQWIHEVKQAMVKFPETLVLNWISRSLRGSPAEIVRSLGPDATVKAILQKLEMMHGAVAPFDVMMRRIFNISQAKGENVTQYATKLESAVASVRRDHPIQVVQVNLGSSMRDRFYQGLKKTLKESLRYLYDTGAPYESILVAARKAEAEVENYKDSDTASAKSAQGVSSELLNEIANIKAVVNKTWNSQQKSQQKKDKQGGNQKKGDGNKTSKQSPSEKGPCFGCGGTGHFVRECPNPHKKSLNFKRGGQKTQTPPQTQRKEAATSMEEQGQEDMETPEDGQEQD